MWVSRCRTIVLVLGVGLLLPLAGVAQDAQAVTLSYVDDSAENCRSLGASGHGVRFTRTAEATFVRTVEAFCARYGEEEAPDREFHIYLLDEEGQVLADCPIAYDQVQRGGTEDLKWQAFDTPAVEVPESFTVALAFEPDQFSGVYVGWDEGVAESHSLVGLPEDGLKPVGKVYDWMVRVTLVPTPPEGVEAKRLADRPAPVETTMPEVVELSWDDGSPDEMQSYGIGGPRITFALPEQLPPDMIDKPLAVYALHIYGSRYGGGFDPNTTTIKVHFLDRDGNSYADRQIPYALFSHQAKWVEVMLEEPAPIASAEDDILDIALDPEAHQTKGIYFHYQQNPAESHSSRGRLDKGFQPTADREWLIRAWVGPAPEE